MEIASVVFDAKQRQRAELARCQLSAGHGGSQHVAVELQVDSV